MDNSITGINNNLVNFSVDNAKKQAESGEFEKVLKKAYDEKDDKQLKKVCKDFEQIMLNMMFKEMKKTVIKSELFENSFAQDTFEEMYNEKITEKISEGRGIGLADMLYKSLSSRMNKTYGSAGAENSSGEIKTEKTE